MILYYDKLTRSKTCPHLLAFKAHHVDQMQDGLVKVYDYYDPGEFISEMMSSPSLPINGNLSFLLQPSSRTRNSN